MKHALRYFKNLEFGKEKRCQNWELSTNPIPFPELHSAAPAQPLSTLSIISMGRELILQEVGKRDSAHMSGLSPWQGKHRNTNKEVL